LFSESQSRLIVEVSSSDLDRFRLVMHESVHVLGRVTDDEHLTFPGVDPIHVEDLVDAFQGSARAEDAS
jgi:phosphoribosylformylglycinamidine (FGAM) synthase-like enzyme